MAYNPFQLLSGAWRHQQERSRLRLLIGRLRDMEPADEAPRGTDEPYLYLAFDRMAKEEQASERSKT